MTRIWLDSEIYWIMWRFIVESLYINASPFRDEWHCWERYAETRKELLLCCKEIHSSSWKLVAEQNSSHKVPKTKYGCTVEISWIHRAMSWIFAVQKPWRSHWRYTTWFRCHKQWKYRMQRPQWIKNGKSSKRIQHGSWTKWRARRRLFWKHKESKEQVHFATLMDICHLKNAELERRIPELQWPGCPPRWHCKRRLWSLRSFHWTRLVCVTNDQQQKVMDVIARQPDCDGQPADAVSAYTQVKMDLLEIPFVICSQWVRLCFGPFGLCVSRSWRLSFPRACVVWPHWFLERFPD